MKIKQFPKNAKGLKTIAENYASAIVRRGRKATDTEFLAHIWAENSAFFVRNGQNFLMLRKCGGIFVASHFCPATIKGGYSLISNILKNKLPIVFCVPSDLAKNLKKIGFVQLPQWTRKIAISKGMPEEKEILVPKYLVKIAWGFLRNIDNEISKSQEKIESFIVSNPRKKNKGLTTKQARIAKMKRQSQKFNPTIGDFWNK